jgi:hypothetical protein
MTWKLIFFFSFFSAPGGFYLIGLLGSGMSFELLTLGLPTLDCLFWYLFGWSCCSSGRKASSFKAFNLDFLSSVYSSFSVIRCLFSLFLASTFLML